MIFLLTRLILVPLAYVAALVAAGAVAVGIAFLRAYGPVADDPVALGATSWILVGDFLIFCGFVGYAAFIPSVIAIVAAEIFSIRSALYFCGVALFCGFVASRLADEEALRSLPSEPAIAGAAALAGGFTYWLLCGRSSGIRIRPEPQRS
ncbi:hypothetical protein IZ6_02300 [Terrihabitans soli]|uniref:Uncharacterized protein n=1 Tax=Terrihabitans soli TaxID=708113 RepID=A0A6S6QNW0_9HYPH|nr:hypothetical protein [Terrihabitans soli]BCJ89495.1 hypothetical protein IZ6_02300 [Terrihabitans soli]